MDGIVNAEDHLSVAVDLLYEQGRSGVEAGNHYLDIAERRPMTKSNVDLEHMGGDDGFVPFEDGNRVERHIQMSLARMRSAPFERTLAIGVHELGDLDMLRALGVRAVRNGEAAAKHPNRLVFGALQAGQSASFTFTAKGKSTVFPMLAYDNQPLLSASHVIGDGSYSNLDTGGAGPYWYLIANSSIVKPLIFGVLQDFELDEDERSVRENKRYRWRADAHVGVGVGEPRFIYASNQALDTAHFDAAMEAMMEYPDDDGQAAGVMPNLLVVPPALRAEAKAIIGNDYDADLASNYNKGAVKALITPWLVAD